MDPVDIESQYFNHFNDIKTNDNLTEARLANPEIIPKAAAV